MTIIYSVNAYWELVHLITLCILSLILSRLTFSCLHNARQISAHVLMWYNQGIMMKMTNCFCRMLDQRKALRLISSQDHCQRFSPSHISDTPHVGFKPARNLSSSFVEWSYPAVIAATLLCHIQNFGENEAFQWFRKLLNI